MMLDLLKKRPLQLFLGLMIFVRGVVILWYNIGEVYLTNDVSYITIYIISYSWAFLKSIFQRSN